LSHVSSSFFFGYFGDEGSLFTQVVPGLLS
jgi:hypothetical protein